MPDRDFLPQERRLIRRLRTPLQVQRYLRALPYNREEDGETLRTFRSVVRAGTAHCLEAVLFTATVLEQHGFPPLALDIESQDGLDHVLFIYQHNGRWGTVARSRDWGLHGRLPLFRSVRQLVQSYMPPFVDATGRVVGYAVVHLDQLVPKTNWRLSLRNVWSVEQALIKLPHRRIAMSDASYQRRLARYWAFRASGQAQTRASMRTLFGKQIDRWL